MYDEQPDNDFHTIVSQIEQDPDFVETVASIQEPKRIKGSLIIGILAGFAVLLLAMIINQPFVGVIGFLISLVFASKTWTAFSSNKPASNDSDNTNTSWQDRINRHLYNEE